MIVKFKGEFKFNSPVYHCQYGGRHDIFEKDNKGWIVINNYSHGQGEPIDNDPKFPKLLHHQCPSDMKIKMVCVEFFDKIKEKLNCDNLSRI